MPKQIRSASAYQQPSPRVLKLVQQIRQHYLQGQDQLPPTKEGAPKVPTNESTKTDGDQGDDQQPQKSLLACYLRGFRNFTALTLWVGLSMLLLENVGFFYSSVKNHFFPPPHVVTDFSGRKDAFSKEEIGGRELLKKSIGENSGVVDAISDHYAKVAEYALPATVRIEHSNFLGGGKASGFIYSKSGIILTNNHVIAAKNGTVREGLKVTLYNGDIMEATVIARDPEKDLAALKIDPAGLDLPTLSLSSKKPRVGDSAMLFGHPNSSTWSGKSTKISAPQRFVNIGGKVFTYLETLPAGRPGSSGGPLTNMNAEVIAILTRADADISLGIPADTVAFFISDNNLDKK